MDTFWQKDPTTKQLRDFGVSVGGVLLLAGGFFAWRHPARQWHLPLWAVGGALVLLGVALPRALRLPYQLWMALAFVLGQVMTRVVLTLTYAVAITGMGLLVRVLGRDLLEQKWEPGAHRSYWRDREPSPVENRHLRPF